MDTYAHPEVLLSTEEVSSLLNEPSLRLVEVNVDHSLYEQNHIKGAVGWSWKSQLSDQVRRDILSKDDFQVLMRNSGITNSSTVVLYGDSNNWFAAWAFWQMKIYGHRDVRVMDGGRKKWEAEGRLMTEKIDPVKQTPYTATEPDLELRAFLPEVMEQVNNRAVELVDVRSPDEFTGKILAPPGLPETCQRGGHIPGASNIPWSQAVREDGTFKPTDELRQLYRLAGISGQRPIITYCRIGERSSHSWFVLKYLLGYDAIKNYDGSWTEWGNLVGAPVAVGEAQPAAV